MNHLYGYQVRDPNFRLRFLVIGFMGVLAFGSVMFWKGELLFASEYQDLPVTHQQIKIKNSNLLKQSKMAKKLLKTEYIESAN